MDGAVSCLCEISIERIPHLQVDVRADIGVEHQVALDDQQAQPRRRDVEHYRGAGRDEDSVALDGRGVAAPRGAARPEVDVLVGGGGAGRKLGAAATGMQYADGEQGCRRGVAGGRGAGPVSGECRQGGVGSVPEPWA